MVHVYDPEHKDCVICKQLKEMFIMIDPESPGAGMQKKIDAEIVGAAHGVVIQVGTEPGKKK